MIWCIEKGIKQDSQLRIVRSLSSHTPTKLNMRAIILLALIAVTRADVGGYTYGSDGGGAYDSASLGSGSLGGTGGPGDYSAGSLASAPNALGGSASPSGGSFGSFGSIGTPGSAGPAGSSDFGSPAEFSKEYYTYTAPESDFDSGRNANELAQSLKRNLRVIFIRNPERDGLTNAAINLAQAAGDSRTAIYVLTKDADLSSLANQLRQVNSQNANKPEVHFVKYRTPEDAANAQRTIQQEYDRLGGSSISRQGDTPAVLNFASPAAAARAPSSSYIPPASPASFAAPLAAPSATYLPLAFF